jgi:hypothetical protein
MRGLGLGLGEINPGERGVFIVEGKGGHQRITQILNRFSRLATCLAAPSRQYFFYTSCLAKG